MKWILYRKKRQRKNTQMSWVRKYEKGEKKFWLVAPLNHKQFQNGYFSKLLLEQLSFISCVLFIWNGNQKWYQEFSWVSSSPERSEEVPRRLYWVLRNFLPGSTMITCEGHTAQANYFSDCVVHFVHRFFLTSVYAWKSGCWMTGVGFCISDATILSLSLGKPLVL